MRMIVLKILLPLQRTIPAGIVQKGLIFHTLPTVTNGEKWPGWFYVLLKLFVVLSCVK